MHVAVIDCGVKENILRSLVSRGCSVTCFPFDYPIHKVAHHFDGVFSEFLEPGLFEEQGLTIHHYSL